MSSPEYLDNPDISIEDALSTFNKKFEDLIQENSINIRGNAIFLPDWVSNPEKVKHLLAPLVKALYKKVLTERFWEDVTVGSNGEGLDGYKVTLEKLVNSYFLDVVTPSALTEKMREMYDQLESQQSESIPPAIFCITSLKGSLRVGMVAGTSNLSEDQNSNLQLRTASGKFIHLGMVAYITIFTAIRYYVNQIQNRLDNLIPNRQDYIYINTMVFLSEMSNLDIEVVRRLEEWSRKVLDQSDLHKVALPGENEEVIVTTSIKTNRLVNFLMQKVGNALTRARGGRVIEIQNIEQVLNQTRALFPAEDM